MAHLMETQKQQMDFMSVMMRQELSNTNNISLLADISSQTLYSINSLVNNIQSIKGTVEKINGKIPGPGPGLTPPIPPVPPKPKPPVPPIPPKPEFLFYCQHCNCMVDRCP